MQLPGVLREDSDDELGDRDLPWEWIYRETPSQQQYDGEASSRKRKRPQGLGDIIGARFGNFECRIGDTVLVKAEGSNEAWVAIICEFVTNELDEMAANFMWFSTEKEIRNKEKKRKDFLPVRLVSHAAHYN